MTDTQKRALQSHPPVVRLVALGQVVILIIYSNDNSGGGLVVAEEEEKTPVSTNRFAGMARQRRTNYVFSIITIVVVVKNSKGARINIINNNC